jgi:acetyl esterase
VASAVHPALESYLRETLAAEADGPALDDLVERRHAYREQARRLAGEPEAVAEVRDLVLHLPGRDLAARLMVPERADPRCVVLYLHGGSFVVGDLDTHESLCRRLATRVGARVVALDYRLAPENPFPAAVEDAIDAVRLLRDDPGLADAPGARLVVMGDSAGATLAAVAANATRAETPPLAGQVLVYPTLGPEMLTDSSHAYARGYLLDVEDLQRDYARYLAGADPTDPRISPLLSEDLAGSPPAVVLVAECDPLRDEGVDYAGLLRHFGVSVDLVEAQGMLHGFLRLGARIAEVQVVVDDLAAHVRRLAGVA